MLYKKSKNEGRPVANEAYHLLRLPSLCSITSTILGGSCLSKILCLGFEGLVGIPEESEMSRKEDK